MKHEQLALIGEAVIDVVKQRLPELVIQAVRGNLEAAVADVARATIRDRERAIVDEAKTATLDAHEARLGEYRRFDETVLAAMREELNRLRVEFDDGLQKHYAEVRRELSHETAQTIATALMDRMQGPPGPPGRDGTLSAAIHWTPGAHIARGSCVQHKGGLWFANVDSDVEPGAACSGYSLMLDGCEPSRVETDEHGYMVIVLAFASGLEKRLPMNFRPMAYAGVYDGERDYLPGDLVTCEGSLWIARTAHFGRRPATDHGATAWQLVVKRGKDGKDGTDGMQGPQGERGPPGPAPTKKPNGSATA